MAGRFIKTSTVKTEMPSNIISNVKKIINNPYYLHNNASQSISTYYNLNTTMTTLDEATRSNYAELSTDSPLRFNKINNFYLYGINKIEPSLEVTEFGLEGSDIQGDAIILPNTIIPYPNDLFCLDQLDKKYIFRVTAVNPNTLDTGAVMYKINYSLASSDGVEHIEPQVVKEFIFSIENYGSNFGCLIESATASRVQDIERYTIMLKDYYISIFYDSKIQSFAYLRNGCFKVHDPYLIEFMIRNSILKGSTQYIHLDQQVYLSSTFGVEYDRTFFSALEDKNPDKHYCKCAGHLILCTQTLSLLYAYPQDYYCMDYSRLNNKFHMIDIFNDPSFMDKIRNNEDTTNVLKDIVIGYFNNIDITDEILNDLDHVDYMENDELYYLIPFVIYCMEKYVEKLLI